MEHPLIGRKLALYRVLDQELLEEFAEDFNVKVEDITAELLLQKVQENFAEDGAVIELL